MSDCVFCKILRGDLPSYKVYEDDKTLAFLDINPVQDGHTLVIPKVHSKNVFEISEADWAAVQETARKVAAILDTSMSADGINLIMNNRDHAGQVVEHSHVHLIPRYRGDGLHLWPHHPIKKEEAERVMEKIKATTD